jgi:uncharacterized protein DUF4328
MSTLHHAQGPEEPAPPPGFDPTRDVMHPPRAAALPPRFQPPVGRAAAATAVFGLMLVLDVVAVGSSLLEVGMLDRIAAGEDVTDAQLDANDTRQGMIGIAQTALFVACAVTFIRWLHLAYRNMDAIGPPYRRWDTGWAIGSWFVPFLNLWRPKQIVNDVWNSGAPAAKGPPFWLMLWWLAWLVSNVLGRIAFPELDENASLADLRQDSVNYMISDGFDVAALALALLTIRVITKRQEAKAEAVAGVQRQPAPGTTPPEPAAPQPA